ncbi:MAG: ribosome recycling factor [Parcubacteria group bacterium]|nr:ribosome recycling factor [Parcubacteria group bacterium]
MVYNFSQLKNGIKEAEGWLTGEFSAIRTGRATVAVLDGVRIDSYGAKVPVNHIAGVTTEDAKTIRITPWDKGQIKEIEHAINKADLGVSVTADGEGLRVIFPELTGERREAFVKTAKAKTEEARKRLRLVRDEVWKDIQEKEREGVLTEDEKFRYKEELQKMIDDANARFDAMTEKKEKEIMS